MKLNLKTFKKISTDEHTTVLRNDAGHTITVAHAALHPATRGQLAALPMAEAPGAKAPEAKQVKMAEGGKVSKPESGAEVLAESIRRNKLMSEAPELAADVVVASEKKPKLAEGGEVEPLTLNTQAPTIPDAFVNPAPGSEAVVPQEASGVTEMTPTQQAFSRPETLPYGVSPEAATSTPPASSEPSTSQVPQQQQAQAAATPSGNGDPYGTQAYQDAYVKGLNSEQAGLKKEADAASAQGAAQAELLGKQQAIQAQQATDYQTHFKALDAERSALMKDIQDQHIDPNHFVQSMDTGSRIATAIGLIASGLGSGMAHQNNLAVEFLHKQIDNDIQAQKANLGQKENLLSANMRQFGNLRDATDMTRVMQSDILSNQLKMEAAKAATPLAQANLLKAAGQLEMQAAPVLSQIAMRKTLLSGMAKGQVPPERVIMAIVPKEEQAGATKELKEAQGAYRAKDNILSAFDKISSINTVGGHVSSPFQTSRQVAALRDPIVAGLSKETAGRFTEQDAHMLQTLFPAVGDSQETLGTKRAQTVKLITEKLNFPELKKWGIDLSGQGRYDNTGKPRISEGKPVR